MDEYRFFGFAVLLQFTTRHRSGILAIASLLFSEMAQFPPPPPPPGGRHRPNSNPFSPLGGEPKWREFDENKVQPYYE